HLQPERTVTVLTQALHDTRAIDNSRFRAQALAALIPSLPEAKIAEARESIETLGHDAYLALGALVPRLRVEHRPDAISRLLEAVQGNIGELPEDFVDVLRPIVPYLDDVMLVTALDLAGWMLHDSLQADALAILAPRLRKKERDRALSMARNLSD